MTGLLALLAPLASANPPTTTSGDFWMPVRGSANAAAVDWLFYFIYYISLFFFALIVGLMVYFIFRYRQKSPDQLGEGPTHNTPLEITWTVIPLVLVIAIFWIGFTGYMKGAIAPDSAYEVQVVGQKWKWMFTYPNGYIDENLHVPVDTPVRLVITSDDVIHSLYIPAFRLKKDAVPGRYTKMWFRATQPGDFQIFCAEYCGTSHSDMLARTIVHPPGEFEKWLENASNFLDKMSPAEAGEKLFKQRGCTQCHSVDGTRIIGPTLKGAFGHEVVLTTGAKVLFDEDYARNSILNPQAQGVAGFDPVMPTYQGRLKDREISAVIEYIKTLK
jgi:cytochrome c oxidase subunit 2